jgi:hypothetical protein
MGALEQLLAWLALDPSYFSTNSTHLRKVITVTPLQSNPVMPNHTTPPPNIKPALESLETLFAAPMVPGEHVAWTESLTAEWESLEPQIRQHLGAHEQQYKQMLEVDQEMFKRVELLRQEDQAIAAELDGLGELIERLRLKTPVAVPNEARTDKEREALSDGGLAFVMRLRKQEGAIDTWFSEAFNRDRGAGD